MNKHVNPPRGGISTCADREQVETCAGAEQVFNRKKCSSSEQFFPLPGAAEAALPPFSGKEPVELLRTLQRLRNEAAAEVERLLAFLDRTDADADLEPSGDEAEPELGSVDGGTRKRRLDQTAWADGIDGEPSLGAAEHHPDVGGIPAWAYCDAAPYRNDIGSQQGWSTGSCDERELCADLEEDEMHDGGEPDVEDEPSLGSINPTISGSQIDWAAGDSNNLEAEHDGAEPDGDAAR